MAYKIFWSRFAEFQLDLIFNFYAETANVKVAKKIIYQIKDHVTVLIKSPFIGKK